MSTSQVIALGFLVTWSASSFGLGVVMHRRGYSGVGWAVIGAFLGPLGIPVAALFRAQRAKDRWAVAGLPAGGSVDVLIGTDGSSASIAAATAAIDLLQERVGRVTVAAVEPYDATTDDDEHARVALDATRAVVAERLRTFAAVPGCV